MSPEYRPQHLEDPLQRSEPLTTMLAWNRQGPGRDGGAEHRSRRRTVPALVQQRTEDRFAS